MEQNSYSSFSLSISNAAFFHLNLAVGFPLSFIDSLDSVLKIYHY